MKKIFPYLVLIASGIGAASIAQAVTISTAIPGTTANGTSSSPGAFVANFYQFALIIGGVLAFGVIVYGGIRYMTSGGNPHGAEDAKEWIEAALLGLVLLAGAYFILSVVNPQLLNLNLPGLSAANVATTSASQGSTTAIPTAVFSGACATNSCPNGYTCATQNNPSSVTHLCIPNSSNTSASQTGGTQAPACPTGLPSTVPCTCPNGSAPQLIQQHITSSQVATAYVCH